MTNPKDRMSVQTIAEILIKELSNLEKQAEKINQATARAELTTKRLMESTIKVDTSKLEQVSKGIEDKFSKGDIYVSKSMQIIYISVFAFFFLVSMLSVSFATMYNTESKEVKKELIYWQSEYDKIAAKVKK